MLVIRAFELLVREAAAVIEHKAESWDQILELCLRDTAVPLDYRKM
jgi:hypothetical protein